MVGFEGGPSGCWDVLRFMGSFGEFAQIVGPAVVNSREGGGCVLTGGFRLVVPFCILSMMVLIIIYFTQDGTSQFPSLD